ncbi:MAG: 30S ribosomal protein S2 [Candidatus Wildermuthbacteria bacterium]|nr:30S ribosomal protein S2 [Candidatus Wildermuthbacteria bacterium]
MITAAKPAPAKIDQAADEMMKAGVHFGHKTSKTHPKMRPFVSGVRNTVHVIDLEKTKEKLVEMAEYLKKLKTEGKTVLMVGTKIQHRSAVKDAAASCGMPYIIGRWIGGMLTNFGTVSKRLERFKELERQRLAGEWDRYTKKEIAQIEKELVSLEASFGGLKEMTRMPDVVFICDLDVNMLAAKEARRKNIPTIGIVDTDINPEAVDRFIPANDDAVGSVAYILEKVKEAWKTQNPVPAAVA